MSGFTDSSGTGVDGWVAAQCLAIEGEASQTVIERLLSQLFFSNALSDQEQVVSLLASISSKTVSDFCGLFRYTLDIKSKHTPVKIAGFWHVRN